MYSLRLPVRSTDWGLSHCCRGDERSFSASEMCQSFGVVKPKGSRDSLLPAAAVKGTREAVVVGEGLAALRVLSSGAGQPRGRRGAAARCSEGWCQRRTSGTSHRLTSHPLTPVARRAPRLLLAAGRQAEAGGGFGRRRPCKDGFFAGVPLLWASGSSTCSGGAALRVR